jgi:hypothetical protein
LSWLDPSRSATQQLRYSTFFGGNGGEDSIRCLTVDASGLVTVCGHTSGGSFPTTPGAYQRQFPPQSSGGMVARFELAGNGSRDLHYSSYVGGPGVQGNLRELVLDPVGGVVAAGRTQSSSYPTQNPYQSALRGTANAVITHLDMLPHPVRRGGPSTPACPWPIYAGVNSQPSAGNASFAVLATGAAPHAAGALFFGPPSASWPFLNLQMLLTPPILGVSATADDLGFAQLPVAIPASAPSPLGLGVQWVFLTNPTCPGTGPLSASDALWL